MSDDLFPFKIYEQAAYVKLFEALSGHNLLLLANPPEFTILAATPQRLHDVGMTKEAVIGKPLFEAHPGNPTDPSDNGVSNLHSSLDHVLRYKEIHELPIQRYDLPDERGVFSEKYWRASNRPVFNDEGEVTYIIHTAEDITAQIKAAQREVQMAGVEKVFSLFMHSPIAVGLLNGDDYVLELANEAAFKSWGKRPEETVGKPILEGVPELQGQGIIELFDLVRTSGKPYIGQEVPIMSLVNGKREQHYFNLVYQPYYGQNNAVVTGVFTISHNVTEQVLAKRKIEESEAKYQALFNSMDQGFSLIEMIFDNEGNPVDYRFLETNPVFETQTGLKNAVDKTAKELVPDLEAHWLDRYGKVALTGEPVRFTEGSRAMGRWFDVYAFRVGDVSSKRVALLFTDITGQKRAEEAIRQSESNLRNTIMQAPVAMAILRGPRFVIELANSYMYELWGRPEEELLHKSIFDGLPEVKDQGYEELLNSVYTTGNRFTARGIPVSLPRDGRIETLYIDLLYEAYKEGDGGISGVIAVATDVTEQVINRKKLEENEAELQSRVAERTAALEQQKMFIGSILEATFDGIYALKAVRNAENKIVDFEYLFANNNIAKVLNLDVKKVIGSYMLELIPENRSNGFFDLFCQLILTGETMRGETHFVTSGIDNWYEYVVVPIDSETVVVSTKDITEKKSATMQIEEQRNLLDSILKNSSNGISVSKVLRNNNGDVIDALTILANEAAIKYIGLPKEVYLSKRATEIEPNIIKTPYYQACIRTLDTGEPFMMQYQMESTKRWLELTVSKLDGEHLIHVFTDVTAIKEAQLQLERTVEDLRRSNQNLEEFAYAASHDLKEPMRKIHLFSDRLKTSLQQSLSANDSGMFDRIMQATNRMNTLIDDLLMFSHVSRGAVLEETIDLNQKISRVLEDLEVEIGEQKAIVTVDKLPTIKGHRRQIQQLFQNLIGNAIKYHKPGVNPEVHISSRNITAAEAIPITTANPIEDYYLLEISDNGIGFEPEDADRIFNVFTRLHGNADYKGTGVGLSIAKKVVENHGGYIWARSESGKGSIFSILLPSKNHSEN